MKEEYTRGYLDVSEEKKSNQNGEYVDKYEWIRLFLNLFERYLTV